MRGDERCSSGFGERGDGLNLLSPHSVCVCVCAASVSKVSCLMTY